MIALGVPTCTCGKCAQELASKVVFTNSGAIGVSWADLVDWFARPCPDAKKEIRK